MRVHWAVSGLLVGVLGYYGCGTDGEGSASDIIGGDSGVAGAEISGDAGAPSNGGSHPTGGKSGSVDTAGKSSTDGGVAGVAGQVAEQGGSNGESGYGPGGGGVPAAGAAGFGGELGGAGGVATCSFGEVMSTGTQQDLDLFGEVVYFADGAELPAGRYRATYIDGCMKYQVGQDWTINAVAGSDPYGWWFVGNTTADKIVSPPGIVGYTAANGAYASFDDCVAANKALPPLDFEFAGGKIGVWLQDNPYSDNLSGQDGRNPKWKLTLLGECQ